VGSRSGTPTAWPTTTRIWSTSRPIGWRTVSAS
jgi:hypothetical protein